MILAALSFVAAGFLQIPIDVSHKCCCIAAIDWSMAVLTVICVYVIETVSFTASPHPPFSSDRQHLSYDDCLEVRGEIIRTVLCCIVY